MKIKLKNVGSILKTAFKEWLAMDPFRQSAIIAYYAIFSLPGLLVLVISVAGYLWGADAVNERVFQQVGSVMGQDTAEQVKVMIEKASATKDSVLASIIGVVT